MGQLLHGSVRTTHAVRAAIQRSKAAIAELADQYDLNPKTVMKWRGRASVEDLPMPQSGAFNGSVEGGGSSVRCLCQAHAAAA